MRTALSPDAAIASEIGTSAVAPTAIAKIGCGQSTSAFSTATPEPMAIATVTPHAGHWNRGRSVSDALCPRARKPINPAAAYTTLAIPIAVRGRSGRFPNRTTPTANAAA